MGNTERATEQEGTKHEPPYGTIEIKRNGNGKHAHDSHYLAGDVEPAGSAHAVCHHAREVAENHGGAAHDGQHDAGQAGAALCIEFLYRRRQEGRDGTVAHGEGSQRQRGHEHQLPRRNADQVRLLFGIGGERDLNLGNAQAQTKAHKANDAGGDIRRGITQLFRHDQSQGQKDHLAQAGKNTNHAGSLAQQAYGRQFRNKRGLRNGQRAKAHAAQSGKEQDNPSISTQEVAKGRYAQGKGRKRHHAAVAPPAQEPWGDDLGQHGKGHEDACG